jgi:hypothetical protein
MDLAVLNRVGEVLGNESAIRGEESNERANLSDMTHWKKFPIANWWSLQIRDVL